MTAKLDDLRTEIAIANRVLANEGVHDAFGHFSARHPTDPNRYLLSRSRAPQLVEPSDVLEFDLDSNAIDRNHPPLYSERVIHGEIYKARPEVMAICHHHAPAFMPLVTTGIDYVPVFHLGAVGGAYPPFWDQRKEFGDSNYLVVKPEEGASLARALGKHMMVLMNRHGVTVAGASVRDCVFRCIYSCKNAEYQVASADAGVLSPLSPGDVEQSVKISTSTTGLGRAWECWVHRLAKADGLPPAQKKSGRMPPAARALPSRNAKAASNKKRQSATRARKSGKGARR